MESKFTESRRAFLQGAGAVGITLIVRQITMPAQAAAADRHDLAGPAGTARHRTDGVAKVRGEKIYARDFRAADMKGWPTIERCALVLRARYVDRRFLGLDLAPLAEVMPRRTVLAQDLEADSITASAFQRPPAGMA